MRPNGTRRGTGLHARRESTASPQASGARVHASPRTRQGTRKRSLTAKNLLSLPPGDYTDSVVQRLTLRVLQSGARAWALRYRARQGTGRGPQRWLHFGEVGGPVLS